MPTPGAATTEQTHNRSASQQVDQRMPGFLHGMRATVPADGEWYQLTDPALGAFNVGAPAPAAGSLWPDRAVRSVKLTNWGAGDGTGGVVEVSGLQSVDNTLAGYPAAGDRLALGGVLVVGIASLGAIALRNTTDTPVQVDVLFVAEDE